MQRRVHLPIDHTPLPPSYRNRMHEGTTQEGRGNLCSNGSICHWNFNELRAGPWLSATRGAVSREKIRLRMRSFRVSREKSVYHIAAGACTENVPSRCGSIENIFANEAVYRDRQGNTIPTLCYTSNVIPRNTLYNRARKSEVPRRDRDTHGAIFFGFESHSSSV